MTVKTKTTSAFMTLAVFSAIALANCGGNASAGIPRPASTLNSGPQPAYASSLGYLTVFVVVPEKATSTASLRRTSSVRYPDYITNSVNSIVFTQTLSGNVTLGTPTVTTMTINGANCTGSTALTCSTKLSAPLGQDSWIVSTYASSNGTGTPLSIGVLPFTIVAGAANTASLTLDPAVNSIAFVPAAATCPDNSACTTPVVLEAYDATGATIIGATPFVSTTGSALTMNLSGVSSLTAQNSTSTAAATSMTNASAITLSKAVYDGTSSGVKRLTATAGSLSASFALTLNTHLYVADFVGSYVNSYLNGAASTPTISGSTPCGVAIDSAGNIYVPNTNARTVQIYTSTGAVSSIAGGTISEDPAIPLDIPRGVAVDSAGNVYLANPQNNDVKIYNSSGVLNTSIAGGTISSGLNSPWNVAVDSAGNIYVANAVGNNVKIYTSSGAASNIAGGSISLGLNVPTGVAVDKAGNIYVANKGGDNVEIFTNSTTPGGVLNTSIASGGTISEATGSLPWGVAVDASGNIYVANSGSGNVKIYTSTGAVSTIAGGTISGLNSPYGIAVQ